MSTFSINAVLMWTNTFVWLSDNFLLNKCQPFYICSRYSVTLFELIVSPWVVTNSEQSNVVFGFPFIIGNFLSWFARSTLDWSIMWPKINVGFSADWCSQLLVFTFQLFMTDVTAGQANNSHISHSSQEKITRGKTSVNILYLKLKHKN